MKAFCSLFLLFNMAVVFARQVWNDTDYAFKILQVAEENTVLEPHTVVTIGPSCGVYCLGVPMYWDDPECDVHIFVSSDGGVDYELVDLD